ncbi:uncharacterized protein ZBAI_02514 [Zygosaccharomyces bailii ISA1307]|nr:uncharacterized protein ZBAI_02514 [Zygosaccharomyces bailii ISA1307]
MPNSWLELLSQNAQRKESKHGCVVVIAAPTIETLRVFEKWFLPQNCSFNNKSIDLLGYTSYNLQSADADDATIELYSLKFPLSRNKIQYLEAFLDVQSAKIKWYFLLDWGLSDQIYWLRQLSESIDTLKNEQVSLMAGSITVVCLNSDHIYFKLRNTTEWHSNHVEFLQQSLRSFCLLKKCSLIYSDSSDLETSRLQVFTKLLFDNYRGIQTDFVSTCKLLIPYGSDTVGLIKTLDETFDPSEVLDGDFIAQRYEKMIPGPKMSDLQGLEGIGENSPFDLDHPYTVDVQQKLSELYRLSKKGFANAKV